VIEIDYTREFKRNLRQLSRRYRHIRSDIEPVLDDLKIGKTPGDQISGVGYTLYKVRIKNSDNNKGKRGGYRVVYYVKTATHITMVTLYSKSDQGDVEDDVLQRILQDYKV
jgi:mRNA-degrading endonuclease RelE of RelBE toxin-antitoxin system